MYSWLLYAIFYILKIFIFFAYGRSISNDSLALGVNGRTQIEYNRPMTSIKLGKIDRTIQVLHHF